MQKNHLTPVLPRRHIQRKPFLIGLGMGLFVLATLWFLLPSLFPTYTPPLYDPTKLQEFLASHPDHILIDVRNKKEYDRGHIPGAIHADYHDPESLKKAAGDKIPITYCTYSAWRGPYAAYQLYKSGYKDVGVLTGGVKAWNEKIGTLEDNDPDETPFVFPHPERDLLFPKRDIESTTSGQTREIVHLTMTAEQFTFKPGRLSVKQGQHVILDLTSLDVPHGFALPEYQIVEELQPHKTKRIEFIANRKGTFSFVCSVYCGADAHTHHSHMSMVGELIVQ